MENYMMVPISSKTRLVFWVDDNPGNNVGMIEELS